MDESGNPIPTDYGSLGNNHHVAIYRDEQGTLHEKVVSFKEAVTKVNQGLPIIDKQYKRDEGWQFLFSLKQNEMFVFPGPAFDPREIDLLDAANGELIGSHLFRVQKISKREYMFTHYLETMTTTGEDLKNKKNQIGKMYYCIQTPSKLKDIVKVRLNHLGEIIEIGESGESMGDSGIVAESPTVYVNSKRISFQSGMQHGQNDNTQYYQNTDALERWKGVVELCKKAYKYIERDIQYPRRIQFNTGKSEE